MLTRRRAAAGVLAAALGGLSALAAAPAGPASAASLAGIVRAASMSSAARGAAAAPYGTAQQVRQEALSVLEAIGVPAAWRHSTGRGVTVAVLDTGTDAAAPDLAGSVITGPDFTTGADPAGYQPPLLHGTWMSSIIAAHGSGPGEAGGMIGVAPAARILSVRVILDRGEPGYRSYQAQASYYDAIAKGIRYAAGHGAQVISMSLGSTGPSAEVQQAVGYAIARGAVVVASAGNQGSAAGGTTPLSYPAAFTGVISVGAVGPAGQRAAFSDRNSSVELSAPGLDVPGAAPGGYLAGNGTSPAAALVSGVVALIRSEYPRLSPALVSQALITSAQYRPPGGYSPGTGFGEVDAAAALAAAARLAADPPPPGQPAAARFRPSASGSARPAHTAHTAHTAQAAPERRDAAVIGGLAALTGAAALAFGLAAAELTRRGRRARSEGRRIRPGQPEGRPG